MDFIKESTMNQMQVVENMIESIENYAEKKGISLENNIPENVNDFDELFKDGGEGRCEYFTDLSWDYALPFGELEDYENPNGFMAHSWKCINRAMKKLQKKYNKSL
jgi:hypothetical protein